MDAEKIKKIADLARIDIDEKEAESFAGDVSEILNYVSEIDKAPKGEGFWEPEKRNVFRSDEVSNQPEEYSEEILNGAPNRKEDYFKVKKIL